MHFIEETKRRQIELQRELIAIDRFLAFYEEASSGPLSPGMTLSELLTAKLISVRLANILHASADYEGSKLGEISLGQVRDVMGFPILDEAEHRFMRMPQAGRKALNELRGLLSRMEQ